MIRDVGEVDHDDQIFNWKKFRFFSILKKKIVRKMDFCNIALKSKKPLKPILRYHLLKSVKITQLYVVKFEIFNTLKKYDENTWVNVQFVFHLQ